MIQSRRGLWMSRRQVVMATAWLAALIASRDAVGRDWIAGSGDWATPGNWSPNGVPITGDAANIVFGDGLDRDVNYDYAGPLVALSSLRLDQTGPGVSATKLSIPGANLLSANLAQIGFNGRGAISQTAGSTAVSTELYLGRNAGASGRYDVAGSGVLSITGDHYVGYFGSGELNISAGGSVTNSNAQLGAFSGATGAATVVGASSQWIHNGVLAVGVSGNGTLQVSDGGFVSSVNGRIAREAGSTSSAVLDGPATRWQMTGDLSVGALAGGSTGTLSVQNGATVHVGNLLSINPTSDVNLSGGRLRFNLANGLNRINYTAGTIQLAGARNLGADSAVTTLFGSSPIISAGKELTIEGTARIGAAANETVAVNGGTLTVQTALQTGGSGNGVLQVTNGGKVIGTFSNGFDVGGSAPGKTGSVTISGVGSSVNLQSGVSVGLVGGGAGGSMLITNGGTLSSFSALVGGAAGATGTVTVTGPGSAWTMMATSPLDIGSLGLTGSLNIQNQGLVFVGTKLRIGGTGTVNLTGGTLRFNELDDPSNRLIYSSGTMQLAGNRSIGGDAVITRFYGATPTLFAGKGLAVEGAAAVVTGLTLQGGTFRANSLAVSGGFQFSGGLLELTGGTITGLSSLAVPSGGEFRALGVQAYPVSGAAGSTIVATGELTLGSDVAPNGFGTQGTLRTGANAVTLLDSNDAVFDSLALVELGSGGSPGALTAANGLTLDFGGNITGHGAVTTPNDVAKPLINNGHIAGASGAEPITLAGYVKGVGTLDNVEITGTLAPGLSPTSLQVGNVTLAPASTLVMEIGGVTPGGGHDQLVSAGRLSLGGALQVELINGFTPTAGQSFNLFDWASVGGGFDALQLPALGGGLRWNASQLYATGVLSVSTGLTADFDADGDVDADDLAQWKGDFGLNGESDADNDGDSDGADFLLWQRQFGSAPAVAAAAAVPEPGTLGLLLATVSALAYGRRRVAS